MTQRESETLEAVKLLHDLNKTDEFIANQVGVSPAAVPFILRTGRLPPIQRSLFDNQPQMEGVSDR